MNEEWLLKLFDGAGSNAETALNHLLDTPEDKMVRNAGAKKGFSGQMGWNPADFFKPAGAKTIKPQGSSISSGSGRTSTPSVTFKRLSIADDYRASNNNNNNNRAGASNTNSTSLATLKAELAALQQNNGNNIAVDAEMLGIMMLMQSNPQLALMQLNEKDPEL